MSKWDAMRERKTLHDFPCPREGWAKGEPRLRCYPELEKCGQDGECPYEFVYRQYIALRAVVEAVLGSSMRPADMVSKARFHLAENFDPPSAIKARYTDRIEAWEAIT